MDDRPRYLGWVTVALWVIAIFMILTATVTEIAISIQQIEGNEFVAQVLRVMQVVYGILACLVALTALLRGVCSPIGADLTAAVCIILAPIFPIGTAVFLIWLSIVRPREQPLGRSANGRGRRLPESE